MQMQAVKRDRCRYVKESQNSAEPAVPIRFQNTNETLRQIQERLELQNQAKHKEELLATKKIQEASDALRLEKQQFDKMMQEAMLKTRQKVILKEQELMEVQAEQRVKEVLQKQKILKEEHERQMQLQEEQDKQIKIQEALVKQAKFREEQEKRMKLKEEQEKQIKIQEAVVKQAKFREEQDKRMKLKAEQQEKNMKEQEQIQIKSSKLNSPLPDLALGTHMDLKHEKGRLLKLQEEREKQWKLNLEVERQKKLAEMAEMKNHNLCSLYHDLETDHDQEDKHHNGNHPDVKTMTEKLLKKSYEQQSTLRVSSHLKTLLHNPGIIERDDRTGPKLSMDRYGDQNKEDGVGKLFKQKKTDDEDAKEGPSQSIGQKVKMGLDPGPRKQVEANRGLIKALDQIAAALPLPRTQRPAAVKQSTFKLVQLRTTQLSHGQKLKKTGDLHDVIQPKTSSTLSSCSLHQRDDVNHDNPGLISVAAETVFANQRQAHQSTPTMGSSREESESRKSLKESKLEKAARKRRQEKDRKQEKLDEASRIRKVKMDRKLTRRQRPKLDQVWSFLFLCCCCPCNFLCA